uniref:Uncharacterized protein n=1 Tax=Arundo donax TaxID=35708 RepID=A0A0A9S7S3_ARUDO
MRDMIWTSQTRSFFQVSGFILPMKSSSSFISRERFSRNLFPLRSSGSWTSTSTIHGISQVSNYFLCILVLPVTECTMNFSIVKTCF